MDGYSISQVAERTGFPPSTLRFYERHGLVQPDRTPAGYRSYGDHHVELLGFIGRAKGYGLSLEEITELLTLLEQDQCAPVQDRLRGLVSEKMADARARVAELEAFTNELGRVAAALQAPAAEGPCDDTCGCTTDGSAFTSVALGQRPVDSAVIPIACTLSAGDVAERLADWQALLDGAENHDPIDGGVRIRLPRDVDIASVATLIDAEQQCCRFFSFALAVTDVAVSLDITAPADAQAVLDELIGALR